MTSTELNPGRGESGSGHPTPLKDAAAPLRAGPNEYQNAADLLAEGLVYRFFNPRETSLSEEEDGARLRVVQLGFSLSAPEHCRIDWLRYEACFEYSVGLDPGVQIVDVLPRISDRGPFDTGHVQIGSRGEVSYGPDPVSESVSARPIPKILGFSSGKGVVCWDFIPVDGKSLQGSDALTVTLRETRIQSIGVGQTLYIQTFASQTGQLIFQCRSNKTELCSPNS